MRLYQELMAICPDWDMRLYGDRRGPTIPSALRAARVRALELPGFKWNTWMRMGLPAMAAWDKVQVLHCTSSEAPPWSPCPLVVTVHDLNHLLFPQFARSPFARLYTQWMLGHIRKRAARVLADSNRTRDDLVRFGVPLNKITVVALGVEERFRPVPADEAAPHLKKYKLEGGYLLYVGNVRGIKNVPRLIEAYTLLREKYKIVPPLVLVGRDQMAAEKAAGTLPGVRFLGAVDSESLPALYSSAGLFAFPSLYEGFGLPPLEAMACGVPVVASTGGSLPEVLGGAAVLTDPTDVHALAEALGRVLFDNALQKDLVAKGLERAAMYSWRITADETFQVYREVLS